VKRPTGAVLDTTGVTDATVTVSAVSVVIDETPAVSAVVLDASMSAVVDPAGTQALIAWFY
jgi:hypothetical protein